MSTAPSVALDALEDAMSWTSGDGGTHGSACISRVTGEVFMSGFDGIGGEDWPADAHDRSRHCEVPSARELDLGQPLVFCFVADRMPALRCEVEAIFRRPGAYRRWSEMLAALGQRDAWHAYRDAATRDALREWAASEGFVVVEKPAIPGDGSATG